MSKGVEYIYPLRPDFNAQLILPTDLTADEARRLSVFIKAIGFRLSEDINANSKPEGSDQYQLTPNRG